MDFRNLSEGDNVVGGYIIVRKLGSSPLRETYEAVHSIIERRVAIKFCVDPERTKDFIASAKLMGRLDHPHIADLYDAGMIDDVAYIITEFIEGTHLGFLVEDHYTFDLTTLLRMMQQVSTAIAHAHNHGVLHRNMKPQNVVIDTVGRAILSDFEIATPLGEKPAFSALTPNYMAPEQSEGGALDQHVDVWGIGATLYWALSGCSVPYSWTKEQCDAEIEIGADSWEAKCREFLDNRTPISYECLRPDIPHYIIRLIENCLSYDASKRWLSVAHLGTGLEAAISQLDIDSSAPTIAFLLPTEGQSIVTYTETHKDDLSGDYRQYELNEFLGDGQYGIVFKAYSTFSNREVALKFLKPEHLRDHDTIGRFRREAKLLSLIEHPNVVRLYSQGRYGPTFFLSMQLLDNDNLDTVLERAGFLSLEEVLRYGCEMLAGLACLHQHDITHRDLKPANMGFADGQLVITDFGLAREEEATKITAVGTIMGTIAYMAPEQIRGKPSSFTTDVYSAGAVLYQMLAEKLPHAATSITQLTRAIQNDPIKPIEELRDDVPKAFAELIHAMLSKDPLKRPTAEQASETLCAVRED
jgi:serine/threonine protein kinase